MCREKSHDRLPFHDFRAGRGEGSPPVISGPQFPIGNRYNHSNTKLCIKVYIGHCRRPTYKRWASNLRLGWTNFISLYTTVCEGGMPFVDYMCIYIFIFLLRSIFIDINIHILICTIVRRSWIRWSWRSNRTGFAN